MRILTSLSISDIYFLPIFTSSLGIQLIISASPNVEITSVGLGDFLTPELSYFFTEKSINFSALF